MAIHYHTQSTPAQVWVVQHNQESLYPVVDVAINYNSEVEKIYPLSIVVTDENTVTVTFSSPRSGTARVIV